MQESKIDLDALPGWRTLPDSILEDILAEVDYTTDLHAFVADELADRQERREVQKRGM